MMSSSLVPTGKRGGKGGFVVLMVIHVKMKSSSFFQFFYFYIGVLSKWQSNVPYQLLSRMQLQKM